jgi:hypothetical protein
VSIQQWSVVEGCSYQELAVMSTPSAYLFTK